MVSARLSRPPRAADPSLGLFAGVSLGLGRIHEICGASRRMLALMLADRIDGPVIWITSGQPPEHVNPDGACRYGPVHRIVTLSARRPEHVLWSMEEALRAGCAGLVIADLDQALGLTPVRRLHLAAEAGGQAGHGLPLGVVLTPGDGGSAGVESRWRMEPRHRPDGLHWRLDRLRARTAPVKSWSLREIAAETGAHTKTRLVIGPANESQTAAGQSTPPASSLSKYANPRAQPGTPPEMPRIRSSTSSP